MRETCFSNSVYLHIRKSVYPEKNLMLLKSSRIFHYSVSVHLLSKYLRKLFHALILKNVICSQTITLTISGKCFHIASLTTPENQRFYGVCMFLSFQFRVLEWIYSWQLPECQGIPCSKQARYWKFLSDCSGNWTHNYLLCKWTLNRFDIQATVECRFTLKCVHDMTQTYSQMHPTDKYSKHSAII